MRTTLNIDEEALEYAKERARLTGLSLGAIVSGALIESAKPRETTIRRSRSGFPCIQQKGKERRVTNETIQKSMAEEDIEAVSSIRR